MAFITSENAAELGAKGGKAERKPKQVIVHQSFSFAPSTDSHAKQTLSRTRKQIRAILTMLETSTDAQRIDRLASALARLNEIERQLANRPLPGSWKPERPARATRQHWPEPTPLPKPTISSVQPETPKPEQAK